MATTAPGQLPEKEMEIAEALRLLRTREGLTQTEASKREGAPNFRSLSEWENGRKIPSLKLLHGYLRCLGLDFCDLQDALNEVAEPVPSGCRAELERLKERLRDLELHVGLAGESPEQAEKACPAS